MQNHPRTGTEHQIAFTVDAARTIHFREAGLPPVLATPWLIWQLETACMELLQGYLGENEISLGTAVDVEHLAPARLGAHVDVHARVIRADGRDILFQVEASSTGTLLSKGQHRRRVVAIDRLRARLESM